ncbi:MAG TPA: prepilin peptidase [Reyranella sp.]|nr:prepilin peptidase [Reyranella sp.]
MLIVALLGLFLALVAYAAVSDLLTMRIPNWLSLALVAAFAAFALAGGLPWDAALMHVAAAGLVLTVCFTMFALGWIGGGDAKLAAATALWLGFSSLLEYLLIAAVAGGLLTVVILVLRACPLPSAALAWAWLSRLHHRKNGIPYGVALALAALVVFPSSRAWLATFGA